MAKSIFPHDPKHPNAPKVFISYSCDSAEHEKWVKTLTNDLRSNGGINAITFFHVLSDQPDLNEIMIKGFKEADKVIIVETAQYVKRAEKSLTGVNFESKLAVIVQREEDNKLVLIKRDSCEFAEASIFPFRNIYATDFSKDEEYTVKMEELVKRIWNVPLESLAPISDKPHFPTACPLPETYRTLEQIFDDCNIVHASLDVSTISNETLVLWPIVPRPKLTIIHFAQLELLEKLVKVGCYIHIIIADCGNETTLIHRDAASFKQLLEAILRKRNIENYKITLLSKYFGNESPNPSEILKKFVDLSAGLTIGELMRYNLKKDFYDETAQHKVQHQSTLKMMSTIFMWTACLYEVSQQKNKETGSVIVAGYDENQQWSHVLDFYERSKSRIGALYIQTLTQANSNSVYQPDIWNGYNSKEELEEKLEEGNLSWWVTQYFLKLRTAPKIFSFKPLCLNASTCNKPNCDSCVFKEQSTVFSECIDKKKVAALVFERINPAQ